MLDSLGVKASAHLSQEAPSSYRNKAGPKE